ncbi:MAG TPA: copper resistance protein B [Xanthomonadaceae bacterium]|nr:copper resistance protein B [Xanthomonadaceae bacterium]
MRTRRHRRAGETLLATALALAAWPALAQHAGHGTPPPEDTHATHAQHGAAQSAGAPAQTEQGQPAPDPHAGHAQHATTPAASDPHATHTRHAPAQAQPDPHAAHAGHAPAQAQPDAHTGHAQHAQHAPAQPSVPAAHGGHAAPPAPQAQDPHAGHDMHALHGAQQATDAPRTPIPPITDADRAAARAPAGGHPAHDNAWHAKFVLDRLETSDAPGADLDWDAHAWIGTDLDRLWLRLEGTRGDGDVEDASLEVLYGRSVSPWWDALVGVRQDYRRSTSETQLVLALQGEAPMKIDTDLSAIIGQGGQVQARLELTYDALLSDRWLLQPRLELHAYDRADRARGIGAGLAEAEFGLRLHYRASRRFMPYVGVVHERAFGGTAALHRADGKPARETLVVAGISGWL